jgi:hypothetical protein
MKSQANSIQTTALLLTHVSELAERFEEQYRKTGMKYNIFKIAGISEREVIMCRVLADFLNPKGLHYRGGVYLKLFVDMVIRPLAENAGGLDLSKAKVVTEYSINENRRIDIVIEDGVFFIPIEVKSTPANRKTKFPITPPFPEEETAPPVLFRCCF